MIAHSIGKATRILSYGADWVRYRRTDDTRLAALVQALRSPAPTPVLQQVQRERERLLATDHIIDMEDYGAGSHRMSAQRSVAAMARISGASPRKGRLLAQAVAYIRPDHMLELGTSLGLSACYQQLAHPTGRLVTIEGSPAVAAQAVHTIDSAALTHTTLLVGRFEVKLDQAIDLLEHRIDYAYFDGNHAEQPTLEYFERCLPFARAGSIFVFDDIYWSAGMLRAWRRICKHPRVTATIDVYDMGFVILGGMQGRMTIY